MDTAYTIDITPDNQIIFTKDEQKTIYTPMEELEMIIAESFPESYVDPEKYARKLHNICLLEYARAFKRRKNGTDTCNLKA
jgi:hypothetical protein